MGLKSILFGILGAIKNTFLTVGPLRIIVGTLSLVGGVITAVKLIKKLIKKIKAHKANKAPSNTVEMALASDEVRKENPEAHHEYKKNVAKTAIKAFDLTGKKPKKNHKKRRRSSEINKLVAELSSYSNKNDINVDNCIPISVYAEQNPAFKKALMSI